jgi:hypothetical protein
VIVDDLMAMCEENLELTKFLCYLAKMYGTKLTMHTGRKHDYLVMDIELTSKGDTSGVHDHIPQKRDNGFSGNDNRKSSYTSSGLSDHDTR